MQLWTEYEGVTIDGAFCLRKLLMPEGRSAFFSTSGPTGEPTVVRLIECHFDEEEILARWRSLEALNHPNFLKFERFGQTELDGRPVVYAVFEKVDGNLAEVLDQGTLAAKDVADLGKSLVAALEVLHTHGFIHEHIEPRNIFAVGSVVKLRGDCIREAPEGREGREAKQRDVRELATVLLQGLTQRDSIDGVPDSAMPSPFNQIIRKGLDGSWGLEKIGSVLDEHFRPTAVAASSVVPAAAATAAVAAPAAPRVAAKTATLKETQLPLPLADKSRGAGDASVASRIGGLGRREIRSDDRSLSQRSDWIGFGIVGVLLVLFSWLIVHEWHGHQSKAAQGVAVTKPAVLEPAASPAAGPVGAPRSASPAPVPVATASHAGWRVVAFTYNRRTDAEKKASDLSHTHPELTPAVFTPSGRAPYMVVVGGVMDRNSAYALARRSRSLGLPRDSYAQNYNR